MWRQEVSFGLLYLVASVFNILGHLAFKNDTSLYLERVALPAGICLLVGLEYFAVWATPDPHGVSRRGDEFPFIDKKDPMHSISGNFH